MSTENLALVTEETVAPTIDPNIKPLDVKPGDYIKDRSGNITRIEHVDEAGNVATVWGRQLLAVELVANGIKSMSQQLQADKAK